MLFYFKKYFLTVIYGRLEKLMKNVNEKAKLAIALTGVSTSGKTTCIGSLSKEHTAFDNLTESGKNGRSKINSEYEFLFDSDSSEVSDSDYDTIKIKKIEFKNVPLRSAGNNQPSVPDSEILELKKAVLTTFKIDFDRSQLEKQKDFYVGKSFEAETIRTIINNTDYDRCIQRLTFSLTPTDDFTKAVDSEKIGCIVLRDTQGLLDFNIDEKTNRIENIKPLSDMGLDNIDGALLFDSEMPVITEKLYQESVRDVLQAVPLFLIKNKDSGLKTLLNMAEKMKMDLFDTYDEACDDADCTNAVAFLKSCKITPNVFINAKEYQKFILNSFADAKAYAVFQKLFAYIMGKISKKILQIHVEIEKELNVYNSQAHKEFIDGLCKYKNDLLEDMNYFNTNADKSTRFFCPNIRDIGAKSLLDFLEYGSDETIIGTHGGITTRSRGKMCFPNTAVLGVAGYRYMYYAISKMNNPKYKQIMYMKLYHCIDNNATIHGWYRFIDRKMLCDAIKSVRKYVLIDRDDRLLLFLEHLATAFCDKNVDPFKAYEEMQKKMKNK